MSRWRNARREMRKATMAEHWNKLRDHAAALLEDAAWMARRKRRFRHRAVRMAGK